MLKNIKIKRITQDSRFGNCDIRKLTFKPGLNLLVGANTCGKSSILQAICLFNGYDTHFTNRQNFRSLDCSRNILSNYRVEIEGKISKLIEYAPHQFKEKSDLNFMQGSTGDAILAKFQSSGEGRRSYHDFFVKHVSENHKFNAKEIDDLENWTNEEYEDGLIIIADEPENSMAINMQFGLFDWFYAFSKANPNLQIIIATHSAAAFKLIEKNSPDINVIEFNKGWIKKINELLK